MMPVTKSGRLHSLPVTAVTTTVTTVTSESSRMNEVVGSPLTETPSSPAVQNDQSSVSSVAEARDVQPTLSSNAGARDVQSTFSSIAGSGAGARYVQPTVFSIAGAEFSYYSKMTPSSGLHAGDHVGITASSQPRFGQLQLTPSVNPTLPSASLAEMFPSREINLENPARAPGYNRPQIRNDRNSHENPTIDNNWSQTPYIPDYIYPNVNLPAVTTTGRSNPDSFKPFIKVPVFNWRGKWNTFISQFEVFAENLCWSESQKRQHLLAALTGDAADFVFDLEPESCTSYMNWSITWVLDLKK